MTPAAFFDIDGTLASDNSWKGLMQYFVLRGQRRGTHVLFLGLHYPLLLPRALRLLPEATFRSWWSAHLAWYFRGFDAAQMEALGTWLANEFVRPRVRPAVLERLRAHQAAGDVVALVSGAPEPLVQSIARMWDVPHAIGSPVAVRRGHYTGGMAGPPCIDQFKAVYVRRHFAARGQALDLGLSHAYADSYSDLGLFELVGRPVAVYPDSRLRALAAARGWEIIGDLGAP